MSGNVYDFDYEVKLPKQYVIHNYGTTYRSRTQRDEDSVSPAIRKWLDDNIPLNAFKGKKWLVSVDYEYEYDSDDAYSIVFNQRDDALRFKLSCI